VVLRYLETQPGDPLAAAVVSNPWLGLAHPPPAWKRFAARVFADLWPTLRIRAGIDVDHLCRDQNVNEAWAADPACHDLMTPGAWAEIRWAQRAVTDEGYRIDCPLLFLLAGEDRVVDAHRTRAFADGLKGATPPQVHWYPEMYHEMLNDPQGERVLRDVLDFLASRPSDRAPRDE